MKNTMILLLVFSLVMSSAKAQNRLEKTLLWEVTGNGIMHPSYLFGTIHLMCPEKLKMPKQVEERFNEMEALFLELDMDDPNTMKLMLQGMRMKDSSTISNLLGKDYERISKLFQQHTGVPLKMMNTFKPLLLMQLLYPAILECSPVSWESAFQKMATENEMEINGLENVEDQLEVFDKIPYKLQAETFAKFLTNTDSLKIEMEGVMKIYLDKNLDKLLEYSQKDESLKGYGDLLLTNRNIKWIPIIGEQAKIRATFFAFGAGHLAGEKGVINLLRKAGFTVKPILY